MDQSVEDARDKEKLKSIYLKYASGTDPDKTPPGKNESSFQAISNDSLSKSEDKDFYQVADTPGKQD